MKKILKNIYYSLLDIITFKKGMPVTISGFKLRLPVRYCKYFPSDYEKENFDFFSKHAKKGDTIIDIGAHLGLISIFTQKLTNGKVYSFEPSRSTIDILKETLAINSCSDSVEIIQSAVDEKPGKMMLYVGDHLEALSNTLVKGGAEGLGQNGYEVAVINMDTFTEERKIKPDFIKIDVEGAELGVLKGASKTIDAHRPLICMGLHPRTIALRGDSLEKIWDFIKEHNYIVLSKNRIMQKDEFCNDTELFDVHLIPAEKK